MDDVQDKVRRNLVVCSTLIVLIQLLGIQIINGGTLGILSIPSVSQAKFWSIATAVLLYAFQRYWFDVTTAVQMRDAWTEYRGWRDKRIAALLHRDLDVVIQGGISSVRLKAVNTESYNPRPVHMDKNVRVRVGTPNKFWKFAGDCGGSVQTGSEENPSILDGLQVSYALTKADIVRVSIWPTLRLLFFAKGNVDFLIPMYLTCTALVICLWRLAIA